MGENATDNNTSRGARLRRNRMQASPLQEMLMVKRAIGANTSMPTAWRNVPYNTFGFDCR
jgi:hypothetical protein